MAENVDRESSTAGLSRIRQLQQGLANAQMVCSTYRFRCRWHRRFSFHRQRTGNSAALAGDVRRSVREQWEEWNDNAQLELDRIQDSAEPDCGVAEPPEIGKPLRFTGVGRRPRSPQECYRVCKLVIFSRHPNVTLRDSAGVVRHQRKRDFVVVDAECRDDDWLPRRRPAILLTNSIAWRKPSNWNTRSMVSPALRPSGKVLQGQVNLGVGQHCAHWISPLYLTAHSCEAVIRPSSSSGSLSRIQATLSNYLLFRSWSWHRFLRAVPAKALRRST